MTTSNYQYTQTQAPGLSGAAKVAWFFIGYLMGVPGMLIAYVVNLGRPGGGDALKFSVIGFVARLALGLAVAFLSLTFVVPWLLNLLYSLQYYF